MREEAPPGFEPGMADLQDEDFQFRNPGNGLCFGQIRRCRNGLRQQRGCRIFAGFRLRAKDKWGWLVNSQNADCSARKLRCDPAARPQPPRRPAATPASQSASAKPCSPAQGAPRARLLAAPQQGDQSGLPRASAASPPEVRSYTVEDRPARRPSREVAPRHPVRVPEPYLDFVIAPQP